MFETKIYRMACCNCDIEITIQYEDVYGEQYIISTCPFCATDDIILDEICNSSNTENNNENIQ